MKCAPHTCAILFPDWWTLFWRSSCGSCGLREVSIGWRWKGEGHCLQKHPSSPWRPTLLTLMPSQSPWQWPQLWWRPRARIYLSGAVSNKHIQGYCCHCYLYDLYCEGENRRSKWSDSSWQHYNLFKQSTECLWIGAVITQTCSASCGFQVGLSICNMHHVLWCALM